MSTSHVLNGFEKQGRGTGFLYKAIRQGVSKEKNIEKVLRGYKHTAIESGPESFLAAVPMMAAGKLLGKKRVNDAAWKYVSGPALAADTAVGNVLSKIPVVGKRLFKQKEQIHWGKDLHKTVERASATAPLVKLRHFAVPIVAGVGMEKAVGSVLKKGPQGSSNPSSEGDNMNNSEIQKMASHLGDSHLREKVASTMLRLNEANKEHEKRAQATKFLYKKAEMGLEALPPTYEAFQEKIASLIRQDLTVLEKALELAAGDVKIGELSGSDPFSRDAAATFQASVLGL